MGRNTGNPGYRDAAEGRDSGNPGYRETAGWAGMPGIRDTGIPAGFPLESLVNASRSVAVGPAGAAPELVAGVFAALGDLLPHRLSALRTRRRVTDRRVGGVAGCEPILRQVLREAALLHEIGMGALNFSPLARTQASSQRYPPPEEKDLSGMKIWFLSRDSLQEG